MKARKETYQHWTVTAQQLLKTGQFSRRQIAKLLNVPRSTCLDHLRNNAG